MEETSVPQLRGDLGLEQFLLLAKSAKGAAAAQLVHEATSSPGLYVFGELLEMETIQGLSGTEHAHFLRLLEVFAFGTYTDYKANVSVLPQLSSAQLTKLKHLTIISLAAKFRTIPYSTLLSELDISNVRELEDLIIEAIYMNILQAKLDQQNKQLEVECFIGRDIRTEQVDNMITKLEQWCSNCAAVLQGIEGQMMRANEIKSRKMQEKEKLNDEVKAIKEAVSVAAKEVEQAGDYQMDTHHKPPSVKKGLRGSHTRK